jgi:hypothetical protein
MKSAIPYIRRHAGISVIFAVAVFLGTVTLMRKSGACLKTAEAPNAIISFELAFMQQKAQAILQEWNATTCSNQKTATEMAIANTYQDFLFIVGYTALLFVLTVLLSGMRDQIATRLVLLCIVAGLLDCVENIFMLIYLHGTFVHPMIFGVFASTKFLIIVFLFLNILIGIVRRILPGGAAR